MRRAAFLLPLALGACAPEPVPVAEPQMEAVSLLTRASLDLRGVRPTAAEVEAVEADPDAVEGLIDEFLVDERFERRVRDLFAPVYRTRIDFYGRSAEDYGMEEDPLFQASLGEEALRILGRIAAEDRPYTDLVTGDWTMADERLARAYPLDYPDGQTGWTEARYTDGRPHAGVLSTNGLWWRYASSETNYNRGRANALSRILLCNDYQLRPVEFTRSDDVLDQAALLDASQNEPACLNCHASLDPLASYLYGFWYFNQVDVSETYHPEREKLWEQLTGVQPGYFGEPGYSLRDLGRQIASDNRFAECAVEQVYEALLDRDSTIEDRDALTLHREAFLAGGLTLRALFRSVVDDPRYRSGETDASGYVPLKIASPELIASQIEALTGYRWTYGGYDLMQTDYYGLRTLAGGVDGVQVTHPTRAPTASLALALERLAEAAASAVALEDAEVQPSARRLFGEVDFTETPEAGRDAMARQVQALHLALYGRRVAEDGDEVETALALWSELLLAEGSTTAAWAGVLSFLMRDPDFLLY